LAQHQNTIMYNIDIYDALDSDEPVLQYLQQDQSSKPDIQSYKNFRTELLKLLNHRFNSQVDIYELISLNTCIVDALLKNIWSLFSIPEDSAALIAIGGYGRRELFPESDIALTS